MVNKGERIEIGGCRFEAFKREKAVTLIIFLLNFIDHNALCSLSLSLSFSFSEKFTILRN